MAVVRLCDYFLRGRRREGRNIFLDRLVVPTLLFRDLLSQQALRALPPSSFFYYGASLLCNLHRDAVARVRPLLVSDSLSYLVITMKVVSSAPPADPLLSPPTIRGALVDSVYRLRLRLHSAPFDSTTVSASSTNGMRVVDRPRRCLR
jgi:hypothetical protein